MVMPSSALFIRDRPNLQYLPLCVAEKDVFKLNFSLSVVQTSCVDFILHLQNDIIHYWNTFTIYIYKENCPLTSSSSVKSLNMLSISMKEFWIILSEERNTTWSRFKQVMTLGLERVCLLCLFLALKTKNKRSIFG